MLLVGFLCVIFSEFVLWCRTRMRTLMFCCQRTTKPTGASAAHNQWYNSLRRQKHIYTIIAGTAPSCALLCVLQLCANACVCVCVCCMCVMCLVVCLCVLWKLSFPLAKAPVTLNLLTHLADPHNYLFCTLSHTH